METDIYFKIDQYRGYTYCIRRTALGVVCCYIDVSRDERFDGISSGSDCNNVDDIVSLPGGCTYVRYGFPSHVTGKREPFDEDLVIGYDYGHGEDVDISFSYRDNPAGFALYSKISEIEAEESIHCIIDKLA